ncbi:hypothetical protein BDFB_008677 [Asbolus verrucosus]|uniref:EGF-like domain-containing protein n=1 Tax=Asbolus verrucosus TaxID=1661398 RepID=A0A482VEC7_ASBVE|nr:hypothetical protein BDFB_008677 [Asbolus verrucosus]
MYRLKVYKGIFCFILLFNLAIGKNCDPKDLVNPQCSDTQVCDETSRTCECKPGFKKVNETHCESVNSQILHTTPNTSSLVANHSSGSIVAGILIPLFLILFVIYAIYVSRKYKLVSWFRRKMHQRNNNYDEFMIGQDQDPEDDDPPLR